MRLPLRPLIAAAVVVVAAAFGAAVAVRVERPPPIAAPAAAPDGATPVGEFVELAGRLYLVPGGGGNTAVFVTASGVVVVDPKFASSWPALQAQVRRITDKPITHAILTHAHPDHAGAVEVLPAQVEIVAQLQTIRRVTDYGWLRRDGAGGAPRVRTYADRVTLFQGDDTITLMAPGPAHTDGDTLVVFHQARVMHAGDMFPDTVPPIANIEGGGNGVGFANALRKAATDIHDVDRVITGHGLVMTWSDFRTFADFMQMLVDYVRTEMRFMRDKNAVFRAIPVPARYAGYTLDRMFDTLDEIDRSIRPRWQRVF